ncbi:MAG: hypothetical protein ABIH42_05790 [Planctomycetota bacterium]
MKKACLCFVAVTIILASGCSNGRIYLEFSSIDGSALHDGSVIIRCCHWDTIKDLDGVKKRDTKVSVGRFSKCGNSVKYVAPGEIEWFVVIAEYPGFFPIRFRIEKAVSDSSTRYQLTELDPKYIASDLQTAWRGKLKLIIGGSITVSAKLRLPK